MNKPSTDNNHISEQTCSTQEAGTARQSNETSDKEVSCNSLSHMDSEDAYNSFSEEESQEDSSLLLIKKYWESGNSAIEKASLHSAESSEAITKISAGEGFMAFASSRKGGRQENQDTIASIITPYGLLLIVCDGMGGGPSGKRASALAACTIYDYIAETSEFGSYGQLLSDAIQIAHKVLIYDTCMHPENTGMGTTAAVLLINKEEAVCAHVGDSRIYQIRNGKCVFRTTDHSLVARKMLLEGWSDEEARTSEMSNIITQAIGQGDIDPEIDIRTFVRGDIFLLCSDGIWGQYPQKVLINIVGKSSNIGGAISDLMVTTDNIGFSEGNHHDNFSAILLSTNINSQLKDKMTVRAKYIIIVLSLLLMVSIAINIILTVKNNFDCVPVEIVHATENEMQVKESAADMGTTSLETTAKPDVRQLSDTIYIVKKGDVIDKIALKFNVSVEMIKDANPELKPDKIGVGQELRIPLNK